MILSPIGSSHASHRKTPAGFRTGNPTGVFYSVLFYFKRNGGIYLFTVWYPNGRTIRFLPGCL
jgi:hypothetical protein